MTYDITHRTTYDYAAPVSVSHHVARLEPRAAGTQEVGSFALKISPHPTLRKSRADYFGNRLCSFSIQQVHERLETVTSSRVTVHAPPFVAREQSPAWEAVARLFRDPVSSEVVTPYQFVFDSPQVRGSMELSDYALESFRHDTPLLVGAADLMRRIHLDFKYDPKATTVATPLEEVWTKRRGVCQDFAHVLLGLCRTLKIPALYVSGYLATEAASATHAWTEVYVPGVGWQGLDPTHNCQPDETYVKIGVGRDYADVPPVSGTYKGTTERKMTVEVKITRGG